MQQTLPTNGQEVGNLLADVGGEITIKFSERLDKSTVIDENNFFNRLTSDVNILDSGFERVEGFSEIVGDRNNIIRFTPSGGFMPNGQYTITVTRDVKNYGGDRLNEGRFDHRSSFTVGADDYSPIIRTTYPVPDQKDVPKDATISIVFNESLSAATVTSQTVTVTYGNPPQTIDGTLRTTRDDFEIVFIPDPNVGLPPNATITVTIQGGSSGISDRHNNTFDPGTPGDAYSFQFETVTEPPLPNNPPPVSPPPLPPEGAIYVGTGTGIHVVREPGAYLTAVSGGNNDLTLFGTETVANSFVNIGRPDEMITDPFTDPTDAHTNLYVIDRQSRSVTVVNTRTSKVIHRWRQWGDPGGLAKGNGVLYVTDSSSNIVSVVDLTQLPAVATNFFTQQMKDAANPANRIDVDVGPSPGPVMKHRATNWLFVGNRGDDTITRVDVQSLQVLGHIGLPGTPVDLCSTVNYPGVGTFAWIACQAPSGGRVAMWWSGQPDITMGEVDGFSRIGGICFDETASGKMAGTWVTDADSDQITLVEAFITFNTVNPRKVLSVQVGDGPTDVTVEPFFSALSGVATAIVTADAGSSQITFVNSFYPTRATWSMPIPGARRVATLMSE